MKQILMELNTIHKDIQELNKKVELLCGEIEKESKEELEVPDIPSEYFDKVDTSEMLLDRGVLKKMNDKSVRL